MPRLTLGLIRTGYSIHPLLPYLLPACRDLPSALQELRWLQQHVAKTQLLHARRNKIRKPRLNDPSPSPSNPHPPSLLRLCRRRHAGEPLQYILGSQPFGPLHVLCRRGVFVPRPETETYALALAARLLAHQELISRGIDVPTHNHRGNHKVGIDVELAARARPTLSSQRRKEKQERGGGRGLVVIDLCAGTGCIGLALYALLGRAFAGMSVCAVDRSPRAREVGLRTAWLNWRLGRFGLETVAAGSERQGKVVGMGEGLRGYGYMVADVCELARVADREADGDESVKKGEGEEEEEEGVEAHVVVANPPYISDRGFGRDTARSARCWEPRAALVPDPSGSVSGPEAEAGKESVGEESGDVLYGDILGLAIRRFARIVVMEVADGDQAVRVLRIARAAAERRGKSGWWERAQIWHDNLDAWRAAEEDELGKVEELRNALGIEVERIGTGTARAVVLAREWGTTVLDEPRP